MSDYNLGININAKLKQHEQVLDIILKNIQFQLYHRKWDITNLKACMRNNTINGFKRNCT